MLRAAVPLLPLLPLLAMLGGCVARGPYPSLAPRAVERPLSDPEAPAAPTPTSADAAIEARAAALLADVERGDAAFAAALAASCAGVAKGIAAPEGSETWIAAQQALSAIEAARAPTARVLSELDTMLIEQARAAEDGRGGPDLSRLIASERRAVEIDAAQQARLAALASGDCPRQKLQPPDSDRHSATATE